jgi:threonine dehydrogenase-like Zn-dependent dehydrogenase
METLNNYEFSVKELSSENKLIDNQYLFSQIPTFKSFYWSLKRNGEEFLQLSDGYKLAESVLCGICSTDLNRISLPFPLPQATGHEIVAKKGETYYLVEISDSCISHLSSQLEPFCKNGLQAHCPDRYVIGINQLPGGFSKYILVPSNNLVQYNRELIPDLCAVLVEPLAAAYNAVLKSPPQDLDSVAVLGPRKLGGLLLAALSAHRRKFNLHYKIAAIVRDCSLSNLLLELGADRVLLNSNVVSETFDIVYDTSGSESGLELSLMIAKREVHLKTTNGKSMCGMNNLTAMVVDEISLINSFEKSEDFYGNQELIIFSLPELEGLVQNEMTKFSRLKFKLFSQNIETLIPSIFNNSELFKNRLPRFDLCFVNTIEEADKLIRPFQNLETSIVKPRGYIIVTNFSYQSNYSDNLIANFLINEGRIKTSRCGDFRKVISLLEEDENLKNSIQNIISHVLEADKLEEAFELAKSKTALKVVVRL